MMDTSVARALMNTTQAIRLLGCEVTLSGISAAVAITLIHLGVNLDGIATARSPQEALVQHLGATKRQLGALAFSLFCGWWGFPWGLILTPVQVTRNIAGMCGGPDSSRPSADLRKIVQINLGQQMLASGQRFGRQNPPPIPGQNPLST
jgi:hypothetical protein